MFRVNDDSILNDVAHDLGVPLHYLTGSALLAPVIEISGMQDDSSGEVNKLSYLREGEIIGLVAFYSDGEVMRSGEPPQQWTPSIHLSDAEISEILSRAVRRSQRSSIAAYQIPITPDIDALFDNLQSFNDDGPTSPGDPRPCVEIDCDLDSSR